MNIHAGELKLSVCETDPVRLKIATGHSVYVESSGSIDRSAGEAVPAAVNVSAAVQAKAQLMDGCSRRELRSSKVQGGCGYNRTTERIY